MQILGAIIAGGKSSRMGRDKALMDFHGRPLISAVAERVMPQVDWLIVNANGDATRFANFGCEVVPDRYDIGTPLAGLHAVLSFAAEEGFDAVLTTPCDAPFLPLDLVSRLKPSLPAIAASGGQEHYLTGLWPIGLLSLLDIELKAGLRRVMDFASLANAQQVGWDVLPFDPFANLNTRDEFQAATKNPD